MVEGWRIIRYGICGARLHRQRRANDLCVQSDVQFMYVVVRNSTWFEFVLHPSMCDNVLRLKIVGGLSCATLCVPTIG